LFKLICITFFTQLLFQLTSAEAALFRVVIDPGHGGIDEGTVYHDGSVRISEKSVTLELAKKVAHQLQARGILVTLTRSEDTEVPLPSRTALANRLKADVFISLHMNSTHAGSPLSDAQGVETYILNTTTDASSKRIAHLENSVISTQEQTSPEQWDVAMILKDLRLDGNIAESKRLACAVQNHLVQVTSSDVVGPHRNRRNRGVKQALFHVLLGADMPSILVEAGFLTSSHDRTLVTSPRGQFEISRAIAHAIETFKSQKESHKTSLALSRCKIN
jgi:N-acetylmuramoyl-L-alanine amidase